MSITKILGILSLHTTHIKQASYNSERSSDGSEVEVFKLEEVMSSRPDNLDRMRRAMFSAATALVSMELAPFSNALT